MDLVLRETCSQLKPLRLDDRLLERAQNTLFWMRNHVLRLHTFDEIRFTIPSLSCNSRNQPRMLEYLWGNAMTEPTITVSNLSLAELKNLVEGIVDDRLRTLLGDPDLGAPIGESVRDRLKQSLASTERLTGDEVADKLGLRW
ncbi:MAG: hypothetical protein K0S58_2214 [Nitrospira sp.]|nr:hypothetical protein [Nitrospira sp.]